jgi:hypothetical protein
MTKLVLAPMATNSDRIHEYEADTSAVRLSDVAPAATASRRGMIGPTYSSDGGYGQRCPSPTRNWFLCSAWRPVWSVWISVWSASSPVEVGGR